MYIVQTILATEFDNYVKGEWPSHFINENRP